MYMTILIFHPRPFFRSAGHRGGGASASSRGRGMTESPCSDMSTRSQSVAEKDTSCNIIAISNSGGVGATGVGAGAHGYNNEAYNSRQHNTCAKPLKQLVVTTGKYLPKLIVTRGKSLLELWVTTFLPD